MTKRTEPNDGGSAFVDLSAGRTHYELVGPETGRTVVLLHGGTIPMWTWDQQIPALADAGFRVLRYDMVGRGRSDAPEPPYDRRLYRVQLLELLDALSLEPPIDLVGVSFGGGTSANFAVHHPDRVDRIVLIAPVFDYMDGKTILALLATPVLGELLMRLVGLKKIETRACAFLQGLPQAERYIRLFREQIHGPRFTKAFLSMLRTDALGDYRDVYKRLGEQGRSMMLLWGTADDEIPAEHIKALREFLPGIEYHALEGVSHGSVAEAPHTSHTRSTCSARS